MVSKIWTSCDSDECEGMWPQLTRNQLEGKTVISCSRCGREIIIILDKRQHNEPDKTKRGK